jgi:uncharacterized protein
MARQGEGFVPGRHKVDAYGGGGFRFADMSHKGSILALPSGIHAIPVAIATEIDEATLSLVLDEPKGSVELLIIGSGADLRPLPAPLRGLLRAGGVVAEAMTTGAAVRTYNMLVDEGRAVAALLIAV